MEHSIAGLSGIGQALYKVLIENDRYLAYLNGLKITLLVSFFSILLGILIGTVISTINTFSKNNKWLKPLALLFRIYTTVIRGTPVYVQLLLIYFIIFSSRNSSPIVAGIVCFGINSSAYVSEIIRAGIEAVDRGQAEAGRSLGLSEWQTMATIILPQAIKNILPALGNEFIVLIKETAIIGITSLNDITKVGQNISMNTYDFVTPMVVVAAIYLIIVLALTKLLAGFERRLKRSDNR